VDGWVARVGGDLEKEEEVLGDEVEQVHLLEDVGLEKFGLRDGLERLDLSLFQFNGTEWEEKIRSLRELTFTDYQQMKVILEQLNQEFQGGLELQTSIPTDEKEGKNSKIKIDTYSDTDVHQPPLEKQNRRKSLTVGSLKPR